VADNQIIKGRAFHWPGENISAGDVCTDKLERLGKDPHKLDERYQVTPAVIMVVENGFGQGPSRAFAASQIKNYGIKVVIAPSFDDGFRASVKSLGLVCVVLPPSYHCDIVSGIPRALNMLKIDTKTQRIFISNGSGGGYDIPYSIA